jgi:hypothetical protein
MSLRNLTIAAGLFLLAIFGALLFSARDGEYVEFSKVEVVAPVKLTSAATVSPTVTSPEVPNSTLEAGQGAISLSVHCCSGTGKQAPVRSTSRSASMVTTMHLPSRLTRLAEAVSDHFCAGIFQHWPSASELKA